MQTQLNQVTCNRCLLPDNYPYMTYNAHGVCNYCQQPIPKQQNSEELTQQIEALKHSGKKHECLIGVSGGRDSAYLAYIAVKKYGLHPLAFCYNNGYMPTETQRNVERTAQKLQLKILFNNKDAEKNCRLFRKVFHCWSKKPSVEMLQTFCIGCRRGVAKYTDALAKEYEVNCILDGSRRDEDTNYKLALLGIKGSDLNTFHLTNIILNIKLFSQLTKVVINNHNYLTSPSVNLAGGVEVLQGFTSKVHKLCPFFYIGYNEEKVEITVTQELGWRRPSYCPSSWRSDCDLAPIKALFSYRLCGFSDYDVMLSNRVRSGALTREKACRLLEEFRCNLEKFSLIAPEILRKYGIAEQDIDRVSYLLK